MYKILFIFIIIFFVSCGKNTIEESNVCLTKSDCLQNYDCKFDTSNGKNYGKCTKLDNCTTDDDCYGNLVCNEDKKCNSVSFKIKSSELDSANRAVEYSSQIIFEGLKDNNFYFEAIDELPSGLKLSDSGLITGTPTKLGEYSFNVRLYGHAKEETVYFNTNYVEKLLTIKVLGEICDPNPCQGLNKTKCSEDTNTDLGYKCDCDDGFILDGNNCVADICKNPTNPCTDANKTICSPNEDNSEYTCLCDEGFYANEAGNCIVDHCNAEINPCTETNRTKCTNDENETNGYKCDCDDGLIEYEGTCIEDVCANNPCTDSVKNICVIDLNEENNYKCNCKANFYEAENGNCYYDSCDVLKPCNTQTNIDSFKTKCLNQENSYTCECDDRYDTDENGNCYFNPCKINHCRTPYKSVCVATGTGEQDYECQCDEGYALTPNNKCYPLGDLCETAIDTQADTNYTGDTTFMHADYVATCGSYAQSNDSVYKFTITEAKLITATLVASEDAPYHPVIHIKDSCENNSNQMACSDRDGNNINTAKIDKKYLEAGTYYIFVDGYAITNMGAYTLNYEFNDPCFQDTDCSSDNTTFCDLDSHICKENKCINNALSCNNGTCNRLDATCKCDEGYLNSDDFTCITDPCYNTQCTENSTCVVTEDLSSYECKCDENFLKTNNGLCLQNPCMPTNSCTETHKKKCSYNILDDSIETVCSCDDNYIEENGTCVATIADTCPGVTLPANTILTGDTTTLHNNYTSKTNSAKGPEAVYNFRLDKLSHVTITMGFTSSTTWDQYLHLRKNTCASSTAQVAYSDHFSDPELIEEDLEAGTYYIFADGYSETKKGPFTILLNIEPLCSNNSDCTGEHQLCNTSSNRCECENGFGFGDDLQCYENCMQIGEEYFCSNSLYECHTDENLCHKRTECTPGCSENSHCNLDNLECDCNEGFVKNENNECVTDLCITNSVNCTGDNVSCNGIIGECACDEGYENYIEGIGCTKDTNPCTPVANQCTEANKNKCSPTGTGDADFICECNENFIEDNNNNCIDNPCEPNPCGINSICNLDSEYHSVCSCQAGFEYNNNNICQEIEGDSCSSPTIIDLSNFNDTITENLNDSQSLSCQTTENKDKIYQFTLDSDSTLSVDLTTSDFNYILGISKGCGNDFIELSCANSISNLNLTAGTYYLHAKSDNIGSFNINFTLNESLYLVKDSLFDAVLNKAYDEEILVNGGLAPYQIELKSGETLPAGLTLSQNHISGTPTSITSENNSFIVTITDASNVSKDFIINLAVVDNTIALKPKKGDLLINEIYYKVNDDVNNDGIIDINNDEFIEIVNVSYKNLSLDGLSIWDSLDYSYRHRFTGTLNSNNAIVIFGGGDLSNLSENNASFVIASSGSLSLKDSGDEVRIIDENDNVLESINYISNGVNGSINRNPDLTNSSFAPHSEVSGDNTLYSLGKKSNGDSF